MLCYSTLIEINSLACLLDKKQLLSTPSHFQIFTNCKSSGYKGTFAKLQSFTYKNLSNIQADITTAEFKLFLPLNAIYQYSLKIIYLHYIIKFNTMCITVETFFN